MQYVQYLYIRRFARATPKKQNQLQWPANLTFIQWSFRNLQTQ